ncbi:MAG: hypothetical protein ABR954_07150 [Dehalococcoidales bacterium]
MGIRSSLYKIAGDVNAVQNGKVGKRVARRLKCLANKIISQ